MGFTRRNTPDKSASILVYGFNYYGTPRMVDFRMGCSSCASDRGLQNTIQHAANFLGKTKRNGTAAASLVGVWIIQWILTLPRVEPPDDFVHAAVQQICRAVPEWPALGDTTDQFLLKRAIATKQDLLQM